MTTGSDMAPEAAMAPTRLPLDCDTSPVGMRADRPQDNEHWSKCLVNVHTNQPFTPPVNGSVAVSPMGERAADHDYRYPFPGGQARASGKTGARDQGAEVFATGP